MTKDNVPLKTKNLRLLIILALLAIAMFGFGFALVPLYTLMCKTLGINGKTTAYSIAATAYEDKTRKVTVEFIANSNQNLPWDFYPDVKKVTIYPGENKLINYYAKNRSDHTMTVQAVPSVSPGLAANYLKKTECFCFTQQTFRAGETREMPVLFHVDIDLPKNIHTITLSYTMFDTAQIKKMASKTSGRIQ